MSGAATGDGSTARARILAENKTAGGAVSTLRAVVVLLSVLLFLSLALNYAFIQAIVHRFPIKTWVWTTDARAVCEAIPLSVPSVSAARVKDYAAGAAVELNSFDYLNNRRLLDAAITKYMTTNGRISFYEELQNSGIVATVEKGYISLDSVVNGPPYIKREGIRAADKRYFWDVQVPIRLFYYVGEDGKREDRVFDITVVRVDPSPANQNAIAVDSVRSTQKTQTRTSDR